MTKDVVKKNVSDYYTKKIAKAGYGESIAVNKRAFCSLHPSRYLILCDECEESYAKQKQIELLEKVLKEVDNMRLLTFNQKEKDILYVVRMMLESELKKIKE